MASYNIVKGSDIMLFINNKSVAHASSHSLNITAETEDINTKDTGKYGMTEVNKISWEVQADHFYTEEGYATFYDAMIASTPVDILFGLKAPAEIAGTPAQVNVDSAGYWTPDTYTYNTGYNTNLYSGKAIITSLNWTAEAGSRSTFQATLQGQGAIAHPAHS